MELKKERIDMHYLKRVGLSFLSLLFFITVGSTQIIEGIKEVEQKYDQWCWAASSWVIIEHYGGDINGGDLRQCDCAEYARDHSEFHDFGPVHCCDTLDPSWKCNYWNYNYGPDEGSIKMILIDTAGIQNHGIDKVMTEAQCKEEFSNGRPFVIRIDSPGHFVVGYGLDKGNLYFSDPWYGEGLCVEKYGTTLHGSRRWTHTNVITTNPPPKCASPKKPIVADITEKTAKILWEKNEVAESYDVQYKLTKETNWSDTLNTKEDFIDLKNLKEAQLYEVRLRSRCPTQEVTVSTWSKNPTQFNTKGCDCPLNVSHGHVTENSAVISWEKSPQATRYMVNYKTASASQWDDLYTKETSVTLSNLSKGTKIQYKVQSLCEKVSGLSKWTDVKEFVTEGLEYQGSSGGPGAFISSVEIDGMKNEHGAGDYTDLTGSGFSFILKPGSNCKYKINSGGSGSCYFMAWIDFNRDAEFSNGERICSYGMHNVASGNFSVPNISGVTRMRVSAKSNSQQSGPYDNFSSGEVEDYKIVIGDVIAPVPKNLKVVFAHKDQMKVSWGIVQQASSYDLRFKKKSASDWTNVSSSTAERIISTSFTPKVEYEIQVKSLCAGSQSDYCPPVTFVPDTITTGIVPTNQLSNLYLKVVIPGNRTLLFNSLPQKGLARKIELINVAGRKLKSVHVDKQKVELRLDNLSRGLYFIKLYDANFVTVKKINLY